MRFALGNFADQMPGLIIERGRAEEGVGSWVPEVKHTYLAKFVEGTRQARKKFPERVYVDLFCGPGRIQVRGESLTRPGGAQIAWHHSQLEGAAFTSCLVADLSEQRARACADRLVAMNAPVTAFPGAAEDTVDKIVAAIPRGALCLAYIDPYNLGHLSFRVIEKLAKLQYVDFAVHFSTMDLRRNVLMEYSPERARFDAAAPGWRDHIDPTAFIRGDADDAFFSYWCSLIEGLGLVISKRIPLVRDNGNRPLYHLVFFSRHPLPNRIWGEVAQGSNREFDF